MSVADIGIEGMTCASCVALVERAIRRMPAVAEVSVNLGTELAHVTFVSETADIAAASDAVTKAGYAARPVEAASVAEDARDQASRRALPRVGIASLLTLPLFVAMRLHFACVPVRLLGWVALALVTPVQLWLSFGFYRADRGSGFHYGLAACAR